MANALSPTSKRRLSPNTTSQMAPTLSRRRRVITASNNNTIAIEKLTLQKDMLISFKVPVKYYELNSINFSKQPHLGMKEIANPFKDKKYYQIFTFNNKAYTSKTMEGIITKIHRETDMNKPHIDVCLVDIPDYMYGSHGIVEKHFDWLHGTIEKRNIVPLPNDLDLYKTIEIIPTNSQDNAQKGLPHGGGSKKVKSRKTRKMRK